MPASIRPAFAALWALDLAFADVAATSSDPGLGAIRLAWWRERLVELDGEDAPVPAEPRLHAAAHVLVSQGVSGERLSRLEDAWAVIIEPFPWAPSHATAFAERGRLLFGIGAQLLGGEEEETAIAGEIWSLHDAVVHCTDRQSRQMLEAAARERLPLLPTRIAALMRPLTIVAALAVNEITHGGRGRGRAALSHRLLGTFRRD